MQNEIAKVNDDGAWLPAEQKQTYLNVGGADYIFQQIAAGSSLVDIQKEHGIAAELVLLQAARSLEFGKALEAAMQIREMQTAEQIQSAANVFEQMVEAQREALENQDLARLVLLQTAHEKQRMLMNDKAALLRYIDVKNRADRAARKTQASFDDFIDDISDVTPREQS